MRIPTVNLQPVLNATESAWRARLGEMFERGQFILGEQVAGFEREFAASTGAPRCVGVGTGTSAIELALRGAGLGGSGMEVMTSALTAPFTGVGILAAGCKLRLADVDAETLQMSAEDAAGRARPRTAALVPVHLYGQPCELDRFVKLARRLGAVLIQDACQAHGARYRARPLTDYSGWVAYSFYPTKNLGCLGDGGALAVRSQKAARALRMLRDGGRRGGQLAWAPGVNSRLDEMQACYLRAFLPHLEEWNAMRARLAAVYDQELAGCDDVRLTGRTPDSVNHLYVIRVRRRERLREYLARHGIGTGVHYPVPLHRMPAFRDCGVRAGELPHAERACREVLSLPLWPYLPESSAREVAGRVRRFYK